MYIEYEKNRINKLDFKTDIVDLMLWCLWWNLRGCYCFKHIFDLLSPGLHFISLVLSTFTLVLPISFLAVLDSFFSATLTSSCILCRWSLFSTSTLVTGIQNLTISYLYQLPFFLEIYYLICSCYPSSISCVHCYLILCLFFASYSLNLMSFWSCCLFLNSRTIFARLLLSSLQPRRTIEFYASFFLVLSRFLTIRLFLHLNLLLD